MFYSLDRFLNTAQTEIDCHNNDKALEIISHYCRELTQNLRLLTRVFGSREIDALCLQIGLQILQNLQTKEPIIPTEEIKYLFIASEIYQFGGHSALIEDYVKALGHSNCRLLLSDPQNRIDHSASLSRFQGTHLDIRIAPHHQPLVQKLEWLLTELRKAQPDWCFFVGHPDDPICVAAMQSSICKNIAYIHHVDHQFTLGLFVPVAKHIDYRNSGKENCSEKLGIKNATVIPLTAKDQSSTPRQNEFTRTSGLITCTSGNNKFNQPYKYNFLDLIPEIVAATKGEHIHIGKLNEQDISILTQNLHKHNIAPVKVRLLPSVKSLWETLVDHHVDVYIDSFPLCGCKATVEAMGAGIPIIVHHNYSHKLLSNVGFVPPNTPCWKHPSELLAFLNSASRQQLQILSETNRKYFSETHSERLLCEKLNHIITKEDEETGSTNSVYETDDLRTFFQDFPTVKTNMDLDMELSYAYQILRDIGINSDVFDNVAHDSLPISKASYTEYSKLAKMKIDTLILINQLYPIFEACQINKPQLSRLLYAIGTLKDINPKPIKMSTELRLKLLLNRIQQTGRQLSTPSN